MAKNENQVVVTRSGYEHLMAELTNLRTVRRQEVARQLEEARGFGDLSENAEYAAAKDEQSKVEGRIFELETMLARIKIVDEEKLNTDKVGIGLTVTLADLDQAGKEYTYTLVGSEELSSTNDTTPMFQRISQKSPVGQAILDHAVGDEVAVKIPKGMRHLRIVSIGRAKSKAADNEASNAAPKDLETAPVSVPDAKVADVESATAPDANAAEVESANIPDAKAAEVESVNVPDTKAAEVESVTAPDAKVAEPVSHEPEPDAKVAEVESANVPDAKAAEVESASAPDAKAAEPVSPDHAPEPAPKKRTRSKKTVTVDEAEASDADDDAAKRKRGRPKKAKEEL